jgi:YihY family inner membrane protein
MTGGKTKQERASLFQLDSVLRSHLSAWRRTSAIFFSRHPWLGWVRRVLQMFWVAGLKFFNIDGEQRAAAFAYYAFFALFPLILLFVILGSQIWDHATVVSYIIDNVGQYLPFNATDRQTVDDVIRAIANARGSVSTLALLGLIWSASRLFHSMVRGVNSAWDTIEYPWWQLPLHSLMLLALVASALFIGMLVPLALGYLRHTTLLPMELFSGPLEIVIWCVPSLVLCYGLCVFFKTSPRRSTQFSEVALPALLTTILLQVCRYLFERYVYGLSNFNTVYGAFAVVIVLLMWIYLSGVIIMYGGCLCAAQSKVFGSSRRHLGRPGRRSLEHGARRRK